MSREELPSDPLRARLREIAATDAPELLAQARERARVRAQALIEDALVDELVAAASRRRDQSPSGEDGRSREATRRRSTPPESSSGQVWWTYGVASASDIQLIPSTLEGVEVGSQIEVVREGALAALVSPVPASEYGDERLREHLEDLEWLERTARRHEAVLDEALKDVTVVPLRLCTLYRDLDGVRGLMRDYARPLADGLVRVEGCAEWGVKVFADASAGLETAAAPDVEVERSGAAYLEQRQRERVLAERASEVRAKCVEAVHAGLSEVAREATENPPQRPEVHGRDLRMLLNGAYLIERNREEELAHAVEHLREEWQPLGFVLELTGPWPPYNFVTAAAGVMP